LPSPMPVGQITCLLSGTFNNYYDINKMKQILEELRKTLNLKVIWARAGESPTERLGVGEDLIIIATHAEMPKIVSESHFGMAICRQDNQNSLAAAVPTKIGEFLAAGRPVIVSKGIGDLDRMLLGTQTGVVIDNGYSSQNLAEQISHLINDPKTPERCRELAMQHFDMDTSIEGYLEIYERMLK